MSASTVVWIDGINLASTFGLHLQRVSGNDSLVVQADRTVNVPGLRGAVLAATDPDVATRELVLEGNLVASSAAARETSLAALKALCGPGQHEVVFYGTSTRAYYGRVQAIEASPFPMQFLQAALGVTIRILCLDPLAHDLDLSVISFGSVLTAMPLGTGPSAPVLHIVGGIGGAVNPTITYANAGGDTIWTMALTGTIAAGDHVRIDCALQNLTKSVSGVIGDARSWLTSAPPRYIVLRPEDGDYSASCWPQLKVSAGSGYAIYNRTWL